MTVYIARGCGAALIYAFASQAAYAELTAQDVWTDWRSYISSAGYEISGTEKTSGNTLTITDLKMTLAVEEIDGRVEIGFDQVDFTENGDGTVSVALPSSFPMLIEGTEDDESFSAELEYTQSGLALVVSGSPNDVLYNYSAATLGLALASVTVDGETMPDSVAQVSVSLNNVNSSTSVKTTDLRSYDQKMSADSLSYSLNFDDPESDDGGTFNGAIQGLSFAGAGKMPLEMDASDFGKLLKDGFEFDGAFNYASGSSDIQAAGDGEEFSANTSSQGGAVKVAMSAANILYDFSQNSAAIAVTSNQLPFPISMELAKAGFRLSFPVAKSDQEQDFSLALTIGGFKMSDMIWGMFDPAQVLPRDPATVEVDLSGKGKVLADVFDPEVASALERGEIVPGELNALTLNKLLVSLVGASLSGTGDFTFDNNDLETFDGLPAPTGFLDLQMIGANGLLDKLIQMGFISDQDAMGGRMMMGMLAVPGDGPDTLNSKIEINEQGQISANGQRIK